MNILDYKRIIRRLKTSFAAVVPAGKEWGIAGSGRFGRYIGNLIGPTGPSKATQADRADRADQFRTVDRGQVAMVVDENGVEAVAR